MDAVQNPLSESAVKAVEVLTQVKPGKQRATPSLEAPQDNKRAKWPIDEINHLALSLCNKYQVTEGLMLTYMAERLVSAPRWSGRAWLCESVEHIARRHPYFSQVKVRRAFEQLVAKDVLVLDGKQPTDPRAAMWYSMEDGIIAEALSSSQVHFSRNDAIKYGVSSALVLMAIIRAVGGRRAMYELDDPWRYFDPEMLVKELPLSARQVRKALAQLVRRGELATKPHNQRHITPAPSASNDSACAR